MFRPQRLRAHFIAIILLLLLGTGRNVRTTEQRLLYFMCTFFLINSTGSARPSQPGVIKFSYIKLSINPRKHNNCILNPYGSNIICRTHRREWYYFWVPQRSFFLTRDSDKRLEFRKTNKKKKKKRFTLQSDPSDKRTKLKRSILKIHFIVRLKTWQLESKTVRFVLYFNPFGIINNSAKKTIYIGYLKITVRDKCRNSSLCYDKDNGPTNNFHLFLK